MIWPVYKKRQRVAWAIIDDADLTLIEPHLWRLHVEGYAWVHNDEKGRRGIGMHRMILGAEADGLEVDHVNGNRLDNRRCNLRVVSRAENAQNHPSRRGTSAHRGVTRRGDRWIAQGKVGGRNHYLGIFDDELTAARVAAEWRREHLPFTNAERDVVPVCDESERKEVA